MTTKAFVGAASDTNIHWHNISWSGVNKNVRRLQARIVKATQVGRWNKAKALQRLLTHSFGGKAIAVRRVTENTGIKNRRRGQTVVGHAGKEDASSRNFKAERLQTAAAATNLHSEVKRQDASVEYSDNEGQSNAGVIRAGSRPHRGNTRRPELLRISEGAFLRGRYRTMFYRTG